MQQEKNRDLVPLEYLARSQGGLWIKAIKGEEAIEVFWKPRFVIEDDMVTVLDFNGDIVEKVHGSEIEWGEEWKSLGKIALVDEMVAMSGLEHFDEFVFGLMRHAVCLLTCGYGDNPADVLGWFDDFGSRTFVVESKYSVVGNHGEFEDLEGCSVVVTRGDDGSLAATLSVRGVGFDLDLDDPEAFTSFVIATSPV